MPPPIAELYFRMLEKHPDARPQTAQEVAEALSAWIASTAERSSGTRPGPPRRSPPRRGSGSQPPAPVFPHGPGSGGSSSVSLGPSERPAGQASRFGQLCLHAPPRGRRGTAADRGGHAAANPVAPRKASAKGRPRAATRGGRLPADGNEAAGNRRPRRRRSRELAGLPIGVWIALIGGLIAVIVLGVLVVLQSG